MILYSKSQKILVIIKLKNLLKDSDHLINTITITSITISFTVTFTLYKHTYRYRHPYLFWYIMHTFVVKLIHPLHSSTVMDTELAILFKNEL